jgi:hypothetical protein
MEKLFFEPQLAVEEVPLANYAKHNDFLGDDQIPKLDRSWMAGVA